MAQLVSARPSVREIPSSIPRTLSVRCSLNTRKRSIARERGWSAHLRKLETWASGSQELVNHSLRLRSKIYAFTFFESKCEWDARQKFENDAKWEYIVLFYGYCQPLPMQIFIKKKKKNISASRLIFCCKNWKHFTEKHCWWDLEQFWKNSTVNF